MIITNEKLIQDRISELRENTDFIDAILDSLVGYAIIVMDFDGNVIAYNEGARQIYGYAPEEVIGRENMEIFFPDNFIASGKLQQIIYRLMEKKNYSFEGEKVRKNGEKFAAQVLFTLTRDKGGKLVGLIEIVQDLTGLKCMQRQLLNNLENFRKVITNDADGIIITNKEGLVSFINPAAEFIFARKAKEFMGERFGYPVISGETTEIDILRKGGVPKVAEMRVVETEWEGGTAHLITLRDVTERKRAEEAQEKLNQQLQAKVSELEAFSYGIAHDLRSPMLSIDGFSRELRSDIQNNRMERVEEDVRLIETGVRKMQQFLNRTLEYSRAGYHVKRTNNVSFGKIVEEVVAEFNGQMSSIGATISIAETFPKVNVDRMRIAQVLTNLIQNSIKYRDKTRPLKIDIGYQLDAEEVVFFIRDNGTGIDADEAEKVFTLFYRGTADVEGSGAGLAIVKRIIEAHEGKIWAEGQSGEGTSMCFTLPKNLRKGKWGLE